MSLELRVALLLIDSVLRGGVVEDKAFVLPIEVREAFVASCALVARVVKGAAAKVELARTGDSDAQ